MSKNIPIMILSGLFLTLMFMAFPALADGYAVPGGLGLQEAGSPVMERITAFHNMLLWVITAISLFVLGLLLWIMTRYNAKANPEPATFSHNTVIEVIWTVVPVIILVLIAIPSMKILYYGDRVENPDMTVKAVAYQWYWGYEFPDNEDLNFLSYMVPEDEIDVAAGQKRLLSTDNPLVLPIDTNILFHVTAADVLHSFAVPALGIKVDAVPGRLNETWVRITKPGIYFGQCSELCGKDHAYMPIEIHAVEKTQFAAWQEEASKNFISYHEFKKRTQIAKAEDL